MIPGSSHRAQLSGAQPYKIHILSIVDEVQVVYRWYGRHKQWWHYEITHKDVLAMRIQRAAEWEKVSL